MHINPELKDLALTRQAYIDAVSEYNQNPTKAGLLFVQYRVAMLKAKQAKYGVEVETGLDAWENVAVLA